MQVVWLLSVLLLFLVFPVSGGHFDDFSDGEDFREFDDSDFAEFVDVIDDTEVVADPTPLAIPDVIPNGSGGGSAVIGDDDDDEATVELEDGQDEFDDSNIPDEKQYNKYDAEEFEGFDTSSPAKDPVNMLMVPSHYNSWESYYLEILLVTGLLTYIMNYMIGKHKNNRLAQAWLNSHRGLLEKNFALVGDEGTSKNAVSTGKLNQENDHVYNLWCSGRVCCEGMLVQLKFLKRQDLCNMLARVMKPACDQVQVKVTLTHEGMDTFVFAVGSKKAMARLQKEMQDLSEFCVEKPKSGVKYGLPEHLAVLSEMVEVTDAMLDSKMIHFLVNNADKIESVHFSDQFSGTKIMQEEEQSLKMPETKRTLLFTFNVPGKGNTSPKDMMSLLPLMNMVIHCIDKLKKFRLNREVSKRTQFRCHPGLNAWPPRSPSSSRQDRLALTVETAICQAIGAAVTRCGRSSRTQGKQKAEKNRARVEKNFLKLTHAQRQEAAQMRREEKQRAEKERIMNEEDPERQRRLEEAAHRRQQKKREKKQMKMKQIKVKAM